MISQNFLTLVLQNVLFKMGIFMLLQLLLQSLIRNSHNNNCNPIAEISALP